MAFGQKTTIVAFPQPGTSNRPFPVGNLPPFVPVITTITDTHTPAILDQTAKLTAALTKENAALIAELVFIDAALNQINNNISELVDITTAQINAVSDLETALAVKAAIESEKLALATAAATNQIKTNNFGRAINKENPVVPPLDDQLREVINDGVNLNIISNVNNAVTSSINNTVTATGNLIAGTETVKGISAWLSSLKNSIIGAIFPPSPRQAASNSAAIAGVKTIPGN
jgi:hypothetical protein